MLELGIRGMSAGSIRLQAGAVVGAVLVLAGCLTGRAWAHGAGTEAVTDPVSAVRVPHRAGARRHGPAGDV